VFKIGEFSKLVQVPVATLRYYDQIGLLQPMRTDRLTGYRYYSAGQLPRLHRILALKGLGFSLEHIGAALDENPSTEEMRGMLRLRHEQISRDLADIQSQLTQVEVRLKQIEREDELSTYDVLLKHVEPLLVALVRTALPDHHAVGGLFTEVYEALGSHAAEALGPHPGEGGQTLAIWYDTEHKEHDVDGAAAFFVRCRVPNNGRMRCQVLPCGTLASTIHHGSYTTIGDAHEAVLKWAEANDYRIAGPDREIYIYNKQPIRLDDPSYVTEIQYLVEKIVDE